MRQVIPMDAEGRIGFAALIVAAITLRPDASPASAVGLGWRVMDHTERTHRIVAIPQETSVTVEITTGSITITGWDRRDMEIEIVRSAPTKTEIDELAASIDEGAATLAISALQREGGRNPRLTAAVVISAPRATRFTSVRAVDGRIGISKLTGIVDAKSSSGDLIASELAGTIRLETTLGKLVLDRARLTEGGLIRLRAFQGSVNLQLDTTPTDARILATTFNGRISSKIPLEMKDGYGVRFGQATLGRGEPMISIDAVTGDIEITVR